MEKPPKKLLEQVSDVIRLKHYSYKTEKSYISWIKHRFVKRLIKPGMGFGSFNTASRTIKGYEMMNMLRKGQVKIVEKGAITERAKFIAEIFCVAA